MNYILDFIEKFNKNGESKDIINCFIGENSYWFAMILKTRFASDKCKIVFDPEEEHFGCSINGEVFDITGEVSNQYNWEEWEGLWIKNFPLATKIHDKFVMRKVS